HTLENRGRSLAVQLLEDDGTRHGVEAGLAVAHLKRPNALDDPGHDRVGLLQVTNGAFHLDLQITQAQASCARPDSRGRLSLRSHGRGWLSLHNTSAFFHLHSYPITQLPNHPIT